MRRCPAGFLCTVTCLAVQCREARAPWARYKWSSSHIPSCYQFTKENPQERNPGCEADPAQGERWDPSAVCTTVPQTSCCREDVHHRQQTPVVSGGRAPGEPTHRPPQGTRQKTEGIWHGLDEKEISHFANRPSFGYGQQQDTWKALQAPTKAYSEFKHLHNLGAFSDHRSGFYWINSSNPLF